MIAKLTEGGVDSPLNYKISLEEGSWINSIFTLGGAVSPFIFGNLMDKIGRKKTILLTGLPIFFGYIMMAFSNKIVLFYVGRFLTGLSAGGMFNVVPVYVGEIANNHNRGVVSSMLNLFFSCGLLLSYCVGPYVSIMALNLLLSIFPVIFFISFSIIGKESPYYYVKNDEDDLAKEVLRKLRGDSTTINDELTEIRRIIEEAEGGRFSDIFKTRELTKAFGISIGLMFVQQFSGIMAVVSSTQSIFKEAGVPLDSALSSILVGSVQLILACITPFTVDTLGRKKLLLISAFGMLISEVPLGVFTLLKDNGTDISSVAVIPLVFVITYMVTYNFGYGPLPWVLMGEVLPTKVKTPASLLATSFCLLLGFFVTKYFQTITTSIGMGVPFLIFAVCCAASIPFTQFVVIETKGKSFQQITEELAR